MYIPADQDVVGVYDEKYNQLFPTARPMRATVLPTALLMDHPMESGATVSDHKIIKPTEISLMMFLGDDEHAIIYQEVKSAFTGNDLLIVQTRTDSYKNMAIVDMTHEETPEHLDAVVMQIKLREVLLVTAQFQALPPRKVKRQADAGTKDRGEQTPKRSSKLNNVFGGYLK